MSYSDGTISGPSVKNAREIYDSIMVEIEPDLLTHNLPLLEEKYRGESTEKRSLRLNRYNKAMAEYRIKRDEFLSVQHQGVSSYCKEEMKKMEREIQGNEQKTIAFLEDYFSV